MVKIVLASASKQRQDLLKMIGLNYEVVVSDIEEESNKIEPDQYVEELSFNKANCVSKKITEQAIIIAADTIIYLNEKKYEKPKSKEEAYHNMQEFSGNKNTVYTGITIMDLYQNKTITFSTSADVYFKTISEQEITWYVANEAKIFKSCGYVPSGKAAMFIDRIDGDYHTLLGLPISKVFEQLKELGYTLEDFDFNQEL